MKAALSLLKSYLTVVLHVRCMLMIESLVFVSFFVCF